MSKTSAQTQPRIPRRNRRGYSIVEIGLVLIIVAVLISAIIVAFYQVQQSTRQGQATNLVNELYTSVQEIHRSATSYGPDGTNLIPILEGAEMLPPIGRRDPDGNPDSGDEVVFSPFGEPVTVVAGGDVGVPGQSFTITLTNYTRANCIAFMSDYVDRTLEQSGLLGASSDGTAFTFPVTVASINADCETGDLALEYR